MVPLTTNTVGHPTVKNWKCVLMTTSIKLERQPSFCYLVIQIGNKLPDVKK